MTQIFTKTGHSLYVFFWGLQTFKGTDPDFVYSLPDGTPFTKADEVEDWIIKQAEQIKSERTKIIMYNTTKQ